MFNSVRFLAAYAVESKNPDFRSVRLRMEIAFNDYLEELQYAYNHLPNHGRANKSHFEGIIKVLKSCRSPFLEKWPQSQDDKISLLKGVRFSGAVDDYFKAMEKDHIELVTLGDAADVQLYVERMHAYRDFNYEAKMASICRWTINLAQIDLFKRYVNESDITSLEEVYKSLESNIRQ